MFEKILDKLQGRVALADGGPIIAKRGLVDGPGGYAGNQLKTGPNKGKYVYSIGRGENYRTFYADSPEQGEAWVRENRLRSGWEKPQGKTLSKTELNKASQYFFQKDYDELTDPKQKSKVYERVRGAGRTKSGSAVFKVKTQQKPLSTTQQSKIKKEFPNAKFGPKRKYGFAPTDSEYGSVVRFAERGYKKSYESGMFKSLPKYAQQELINAFPDIKFNFEKEKAKVIRKGGKNVITTKGIKFSKYGIPYNDPNYSRVSRYFDDPKPFRYGFDLRNAGGWTLAQMDRAALQGNENYEPILQKPNKPISTNNKIIGMKDKTGGRTRIYKINNIKNHPDFPEIQKVYSIAEKSRTPLTDYPTIVKLLPKGFDPSKIQLNDLLQFISDEKGKEGLNRAQRAIEIHHVEGVKNRATGNFQLLRRDLNKLADTIGQQISKGKLDRSAELIEKNIRTIVDGKKFGARKVSPQQDFRNIISGVEDKLKIYNQKDFNRLKNFIANPRAAALLLPTYLGYEYVPEVLRKTGVVQREYKQTAGIGNMPIAEKAPSLAEKAVGAGTTAAIAGSKPGRKVMEKIFQSRLGSGLASPATILPASISEIKEDPTNPLPYLGVASLKPTTEAVSRAFNKGPISRGIGQVLNLGLKSNLPILRAVAPRLLAFAGPVGLGISGILAAKQGIDYLQEKFDKMSPEEKQKYYDQMSLDTMGP